MPALFLRRSPFRIGNKSLTALCTAALLCTSPVLAQDFNRAPSTWQEHLDLQTSGAAASIILHLRCADDESQKQALEVVGQRLAQIIDSLRSLGAEEAPARSYASNAYRTKMAALWQSSSSSRCTELQRLQDLARYLGYPLPR